MDIAHEAYINWKSQYKLLLRTFSEEQLFAFGFDAANKVSTVMEEVIQELQTQVAELNERIAKLDKPKKAAKSE